MMETNAPRGVQTNGIGRKTTAHLNLEVSMAGIGVPTAIYHDPGIPPVEWTSKRDAYDALFRKWNVKPSKEVWRRYGAAMYDLPMEAVFIAIRRFIDGDVERAGHRAYPDEIEVRREAERWVGTIKARSLRAKLEVVK